MKEKEREAKRGKEEIDRLKKAHQEKVKQLGEETN